MYVLYRVEVKQSQHLENQIEVLKAGATEWTGTRACLTLKLRLPIQLKSKNLEESPRSGKSSWWLSTTYVQTEDLSRHAVTVYSNTT